MTGTVFDIKEFALHDGAGIRTTVFLKGCPLRCIWCHNPEGLRRERELSVQTVGCRDCGLCRQPCEHEDCRGLGRCLHVCPMGLISAVGETWESEALARRLMRGRELFAASGGGVTLSGGEPLTQHDFVLDLLAHLRGQVHCAIETSGYAPPEVFRSVVSACDFVYMDIKLWDSAAHRRYTGVENEEILANARYLRTSHIPHAFRVPLIPGMTDTEDNLRPIADFVGEDRVELLPYNRLAPAKYSRMGWQFSGEIDANRAAPIDLSLFQNAVLRK